jgi:ArsR family metal-binding transcriptional regulator
MENGKASESEILINGYTLELIEPPCEPGAERWTAKAHIDDDIAEALPYLNAEFKKARYFPDRGALTMEYQTKKCSFRAHEMGAALFNDRQQAIEFMDELVKLVNTVWAKRRQIQPSYVQREPPRVMDILKLLPRTNCKECGYLTCMAFAAQLREGAEETTKCTQLLEQNREQLRSILDGN